MKRFDEDGFGQLLAQREAPVADLANQAGITTKKFDALLLAKAHFAQPAGGFR